MDTLILIACLFSNDVAACSAVPETSIRAPTQMQLFEELRILLPIVLIADSPEPTQPKIVGSSQDIKTKPTTTCPGPTPLASFLCDG